MNDLFIFTLSYLVVLIMAIGVIGFFQGGMFLPWLRARTSREQKVLVKIRGQVKDRFSAGRITDGFLVFKDGKEKKRVAVLKGCAYKAIGVWNVDIDDEKNAVCMPDYTTAPGYDAVKHENLHVRALTAPQLEDRMMKILIALVVITLAVAALTAFLVYQVSAQVEALGAIAQTVPK